MNTKLFSKLAIGAIAATGLLANASIANAGIVKETAPQVESFGPSQTDFNVDLTFDQFDPATDPVIDPGETYNSFNSVHITLEGTGVSGPGSVFCNNPDASGRCQGTVSSDLTVTLGVPSVPEIAVLEIPLIGVPLPYDLGLNESFVIPEVTSSDSITVVYDLKEGLGGTPAEIQAILDAFEGAGTIDVNIDSDGEFMIDEATGSALFGNPIQAEGSASIFYDYHVEVDDVDIPEPASLLGLAFIGGLGLLAKNKKS